MTGARALAVAGALAVGALAAPSASAAVTDDVSQNWAGYAATGARFQKVSGAWVVPKLHCSAGTKRYSGVWVGLGGFSATSQSIEQAGTDQNCGKRGHAKYSAWYELVPDDPVTIKMTINPGDRISASVSVSGSNVKIRLRDKTRDKTFTVTKHMSSPDVTSADWIVEAPADCSDQGCTTLPLADFGTASLSSSLATKVGGKAHAISKGKWAVTRLRLSDPAGGGATASGLSGDGRSFKVKYHKQARSKRLSKASRGGRGRRPA